ncbi:MAG: hypothetical protein DMF71_06750 [Acidobacteria bacterium]|nr:MAG: hypothetical protein DMF71_06750 [Acidobacteriota bacterium]
MALLLVCLETNSPPTRTSAAAFTGSSSSAASATNDVEKTVTFTPAPDGTKTFMWNTRWFNEGVPILAPCNRPSYGHLLTPKEVAGQILVGYIHHWDPGHDPFPCKERKTEELAGVVWFDLGEIYDKPSLAFAKKAVLKFKALESGATDNEARRLITTCRDELQLPGVDWIKTKPGNAIPKTGPLEPRKYIECRLSEECSIDVTSIVNNWITGREDRYGFTIVGPDESGIIKDEAPSDNAGCTTRYGDFQLTVTYKYEEKGPPIIILPLPEKPSVPVGGASPSGGGGLETRTNYALAANGGTAKASSQYNDNYSSAAAINGEVLGIHKGSDPATGSLWHSDSPTFPQWLEVTFAGGSSKLISEIDLFTFQDNVDAPESVYEGTTTFSKDKYGLTQFQVQYWHYKFGWVDIPNATFTAEKANSFVWNKFKLDPNIQTTKIRVLTHASGDGYSRIVELQAWGK